MAITFRHDAAAVALPSSSASTRKYGQSLVMQQQQQKYAAQQAGYDRMFDAYKMENQNQVQQQRDWQQRDFVLNRDRDQNKFQQQQMDAARQQQFMDEARKMESGMIMNDIQNGLYDTNTARELQQTLALEAEALGNPQYDATQRAEALQKIRARRALLASNRLEKPPAPTPDEEIANLPEINGTKYQKNAKTGMWEPFQPSKAQQEQEKQQQQQLQQQEQEAQKMRPKSMEEYYSDNEDKFQKDLDNTMKSMQEEQGLITDPTKRTPVTKESALDRMKKDYDFRQKALGRSQYGEPTLAPEQPGAAPSQPGEMKSILEQPDAPQPDMSQMENPLPSEYAPPSIPEGTAASAAYQAIMEGKGYKLITPTDGTRPYYYKGQDPTKPLSEPQQNAATPTNEYDAAVAANGTGRMPYDVPQRAQPTPAAPAQNAWEDVALPPNAGQPVQKQLDPMPPRLSKKSPAAPTAPAVPDFGALTSSATSDRDKMFYNKVQQVYQGQTPEVQSAIGVILDPNSQDQDFLQAQMYLQQNGIDINQLMAGTPPKQARSAPSRTQPSRPVSPRSAGSKGYYKK